MTTIKLVKTRRAVSQSSSRNALPTEKCIGLTHIEGPGFWHKGELSVTWKIDRGGGGGSRGSSGEVPGNGKASSEC